MRRILVLLVLVIGLMVSESFAELTQNASPISVAVGKNTRYKNISLSPPSRNVEINNNDPNNHVWVDLKSDTNTVDKSSCILMGPGDTLDLYDYITSGITFIWCNEYATGKDTSPPIAVLITY